MLCFSIRAISLSSIFASKAQQKSHFSFSSFLLPLSSSFSSSSDCFFELQFIHANMKSLSSVSLPDHKSRLCLCSLFMTVALICVVYFTGNALLAKDFTVFLGLEMNSSQQNGQCRTCKDKCRPVGSDALPQGIVSKASNLEMRPLWGDVDNMSPHSINLLAIAVGIKQKELVNKIVKKFLEHDFVVMLFHYDGVVDKWNDLEWNSRAIHVSAMNQTKWWFAKRFLHPDIVSEYDYIFLWDEDLGVESFHPDKYLSIVREEGLEISQPALDPGKSEVHHPITVRRRNSRVHRRFYRFKGGLKCYSNSTAPPCVGWVEMMAPVFSKAAWRCAWYMVQNDLIHAWGLDKKLGYCAQGDRTKKVGVVDVEYITHLGVPTLGGGNSDGSKLSNELKDHYPRSNSMSDSEALATALYDSRSLVRNRSFIEMKIFRERWLRASKEDECWVDPFSGSRN